MSDKYIDNFVIIKVPLCSLMTKTLNSMLLQASISMVLHTDGPERRMNNIQVSKTTFSREVVIFRSRTVACLLAVRVLVMGLPHWQLFS